MQAQILMPYKHKNIKAQIWRIQIIFKPLTDILKNNNKQTDTKCWKMKRLFANAKKVFEMILFRIRFSCLLFYAKIVSVR